MELRFENEDPTAASVDALIIPVASANGGPTYSVVAMHADAALSGELERLAADAKFTAGAGKTLVIPTIGNLPARRVVLAGLGPNGGTKEESLLKAGGAALRAARDAGATNVAIALPDLELGSVRVMALEALATGAMMGAYRFDAYRGASAPVASKRPDVESVRFVDEQLDEGEAREALRRAQVVAGAVALARDLVNEPASVLTPATFAERAKEVAKSGSLEIEVLEPGDLEALGAAAILAVGGGSANSPRLIRLRYQPASQSDSSRVPGLVGKAITFDTGGYSIKPYEGMLEMKGDMAGGAAVLAAMSALKELGCTTPVVATICAAENMISGTAYRPGDVITGMNGVTMEILSTDAEGRVVLADGLVDTARRGATELIDLATLTGAAVVALGDGTTALFASDDELAARLLDAANGSGEAMWRLPLTESLEAKIEGDVADIKNTGGRAGGAITGALFLQHFREGLPWAHLDIAPSSRQQKSTALGPKGATGEGVRTLLRYLTGGHRQS